MWCIYNIRRCQYERITVFIEKNYGKYRTIRNTEKTRDYIGILEKRRHKNYKKLMNAGKNEPDNSQRRKTKYLKISRNIFNAGNI